MPAVQEQPRELTGVRIGPFVDHGDGTVTDTNTGLMWAKIPEYRDWTYGRSARYCDGLDLGGHTDWRVPTVDDFNSLYRSLGQLDPAPARHAVEPFQSRFHQYSVYWNYLWTSTDTGSRNMKFGFELSGDGNEGTLAELNGSALFLPTLPECGP